jgi:ABC-type lipoprotein release transport system permease subunit
MSPHRLALRTLLLARPRSVLTVLLITACLCLLSLFAGNIASTRVRLEYQAVTGERLGHLSITRRRDALGTAFEPADAQRVKRLAEAVAGVAQVVPQMRVSGIASTGQRSALFHGEGIGGAGTGPRNGADPDPRGKLNPAQANGIALSSDNARALGLLAGANLTLTAVSADAPAAPLKAEVVDIFGTAEFNEAARSVLMPFEMAQNLLATERTERMVVYLADARRLDAVCTALRGVLREAGFAVDVHTWQELSPTYIKARSASDLTFDSIAGMVFAAIAAAVAATISMNAFERRREVATLRACGMHSSGVFLMFAAEALWMAAFAVVLSVVGSGLIAWVVNRAALSYATQQALKQAPMLVELDFNRMLMAMVTVMAVALLAALAPAFKAARAEVAEGLAA